MRHWILLALLLALPIAASSTVYTQEHRVTYAGAGQTALPVPFPFLDPDHLRVTLIQGGEVYVAAAALSAAVVPQTRTRQRPNAGDGGVVAGFRGMLAR